MREFKVVSKYKNPDKYIETLKSELAYKETVLDNIKRDRDNIQDERNKLKGSLNLSGFFEYKNNGGKDFVQSLSDSGVLSVLRNQVKFGTDIVLYGKISKILTSVSENEVSIKITNVYYKK